MCPPSAGATRLWEPAPKHSPATTNSPDCVPSDPVSRAAYTHASRHLHPDILNHSLRVYLLALNLGTREESPLVKKENIHLLFAACILHDIGTTSSHNGPQRFEVEGADAAKSLLLSHGVHEAEAHGVWIAIALHTSPGIAERIYPLARLVRLGVAQDFKRASALRLAVEGEIADFEARFPRGEIEKVLGDGVVGQVLELERKGEGERQREGDVNLEEVVGTKAPAASWPGVLLRSAKENPGWEGVNKAF